MNELTRTIAQIIREGNPPEGEAIHENVLAREIAKAISEEIGKCLLTDEEITSQLNALGENATYGNGLKATAQAQLQKTLALIMEEHGN